MTPLLQVTTGMGTATIGVVWGLPPTSASPNCTIGRYGDPVRNPKLTQQERYDLQALEALQSRLPTGAIIRGSVVHLPVPPGTPPSQLAAGSIRVSKGRDEMISPEIQWDSIQAHVQKRRLTLAKVFLDMHKSGRAFEKRAVKIIVEDVTRGDYLWVVLWKWSRWGRNVRWSQVYLAGVESAGGRVESATEDLDPKTPIGRFTRTQLLALAELESDQKSEAWKETHANRRLRQLPHSGSPRLGYVYERGKGYTPHPVAGKALADCYRDYLSGMPIRRLAMRMNDLGVTTSAGGRVTPTSLRRSMDTGFAAGLIREQSAPPEGASSTAWSQRVFDVWRRGAHTALIDEETWVAYQERRKEQVAPRAAARTHELSGLMWHVECEGTMTSAYSGNGGYHVWRCITHLHYPDECAGTSISNRLVMAGVWKWLDEEERGADTLQGRIERARRADSLAAEVTRLETRIAELSRRLKRLRMLYVDDDDYTLEAYNAEKAPVQTELREAQAALLRMRQAATTAATPEHFNALRSAWDTISVQARRESLGRLIRRVEVQSPLERRGCLGGGDRVRVVPMWDQ